MGEQEWATCHANAADQTVHLAGTSGERPDSQRALCWRDIDPRQRSRQREILHHMTDHAAPLIAKLTAELAASYVVRLCQREIVTSN